MHAKLRKVLHGRNSILGTLKNFNSILTGYCLCDIVSGSKTDEYTMRTIHYTINIKEVKLTP
jgi:hypothetical protein